MLMMNTNGGVEVEEEKKMKMLEISNGSLRYEIVLRMMGLILTLVAAVVAGTNMDTELVSVSLVQGLPPLQLTLTAKWNYMSSTVYFVAVNAVACAYAAISIALQTLMRPSWRNSLCILAIDLIIMSLLFTANGASAAVGIIALHGNSHTQWHKVCYAFKRYCVQGAAAIVASLLASFIFLLLLLLLTLNLHRTQLFL